MPLPPANLGTCLDGVPILPGEPDPTILFTSSSHSCVCLLALLLPLLPRPPSLSRCCCFFSDEASGFLLLLLLSPVRSYAPPVPALAAVCFAPTVPKNQSFMKSVRSGAPSSSMAAQRTL